MQRGVAVHRDLGTQRAAFTPRKDYGRSRGCLILIPHHDKWDVCAKRIILPSEYSSPLCVVGGERRIADPARHGTKIPKIFQQGRINKIVFITQASRGVRLQVKIVQFRAIHREPRKFENQIGVVCARAIVLIQRRTGKLGAGFPAGFPNGTYIPVERVKHRLSVLKRVPAEG